VAPCCVECVICTVYGGHLLSVTDVGVACDNNLWLVLKLAFRSAIWNCVVHVVSWERLVLLNWLYLSLSISVSVS
jgi:hypothetical protein